jgi:hypothetical protein
LKRGQFIKLSCGLVSDFLGVEIATLLDKVIVEVSHCIFGCEMYLPVVGLSKNGRRAKFIILCIFRFCFCYSNDSSVARYFQSARRSKFI